MDSKLLAVGAIVIALFFAAFMITGVMNEIDQEYMSVKIRYLHIVLKNLFDEKPFGSLAILDPKDLPEEVANEHLGPGILFKWRDSDGGKVPPDGSWGWIGVTEEQLEEEGCGNEVSTVLVRMKVYVPNATAAARGYKLKYHLIGFEAATNGGCKVGNTHFTEEYLRNGYYTKSPGKIEENFWDSASCTVAFAGWDGPPVKCTESFYYPEAMIQAIGPAAEDVESGAWVFVNGFQGISAWPLGHEKLTQDYLVYLQDNAPSVLDLVETYTIQDVFTE